VRIQPPPRQLGRGERGEGQHYNLKRGIYGGGPTGGTGFTFEKNAHKLTWTLLLEVSWEYPIKGTESISVLWRNERNKGKRKMRRQELRQAIGKGYVQGEQGISKKHTIVETSGTVRVKREEGNGGNRE